MAKKNNLKDLRLWLFQDHDRHIRPLLSVRAALRVLPIVLEVAERGRLKDDSQQVILHAFRATFICWAMQKFELTGRGSATSAASSAARSPSSAARKASFFVARSSRFAAASAAASVSTTAANSAFESIESALKAADEFALAGQLLLDSVDADIQWLMKNRNSKLLINQRLWLNEVREDRRYSINIPKWARGPMDLFSVIPQVAGGPWEVMIDWYKSILTETSVQSDLGLLKPQTALHVASQPRGFWHREPNDVIADIAYFTGWRRPISRRQPDPPQTMKEFAVEYLSSENRAFSTREIYQAFEAAGFQVEPPSIRGRLNTLADENKIRRVSRGSYASPEFVKSKIEDTAKETPSVPRIRPAAIEPLWLDGKLSLPTTAPESQLDPVSLISALVSLREEILELTIDADEIQNIDRRPIDYMRRLAEKIPDAIPSQVLLFRLGHARDVLDSYAITTDAEWPDFLAARYRRMLLLYDRTTRQFAKWREFLRNAADQQLTPEQVAEVPSIVKAIASELRSADSAEFIEPSVPDALEATGDPIAGWDDVLQVENDRLAEDLLESINNVLKRLADLALAIKSAGIDPLGSWAALTARASIVAYGKEAKKSIVAEFGKLGRSTGQALIKVLKRMLKVTVYGGGAAGGGVLIQRLFNLYPEMFGWLQPVLNFLRLA